MRVSEERGIIAAEGTASNQDTWALLYRPEGGRHCLEFSVNGGQPEVASGFDIPELTEVGFAGSLTPGAWTLLPVRHRHVPNPQGVCGEPREG